MDPPSEATTTETPTPAEGATPDDKKSTPTEGDAPTAEGAETVEAEAADDQDDAEGAPETYQFEAPEGVNIDMESPEAKEFIELARADNLSNAQAQKYFSLFANAVTGATQAAADASTQAWDKESKTDWQAAVMADELIGGTKEEVTAKLGGAGKLALEKYGDKDLGELMTRFRLGNNPAFNRFVYRVGLTLQEDTSIPRPGDASEGPKSDAEVFFGT